MKIEIEIKTNTITWYPDKVTDASVSQKVEQSTVVKVSTEEPKTSLFKALVRTAFHQLVPSKPLHTKIVIYTSARESMRASAISEEIVKDVIYRPDRKEDGWIRQANGKSKKKKNARLFKDYPHYTIGVIAPYNSITKTYAVFSVNRWERKRSGRR